MIAENGPGCDGRYHARDDDGWEGPRAKRAQDLLEGKERPCQRGVEGGRDSGRHTRGDEHRGSRGGETEEARRRRSQRGTQDRDGTLAAGRATASDGQRAGRRANQGWSQRNISTTPCHPELYVGNRQSLLAGASRRISAWASMSARAVRSGRYAMSERNGRTPCVHR